MSEREEIEKIKRRGARTGLPRKRYTFEEKLRAVKLHVEEGFSWALVCQETGVSMTSLGVWVRAFRKEGEQGLRREGAPRPGRSLPQPVKDKIVELKRKNPWFGVKKIADGLARWFFLEASPETVRKTLHEAELMDKRPKARRNLTRPRFFERATPNQLWQTDIFTFRLGGKYAYAVAFLDDYSRYVVNLDLYRSPTAEAVIETYRVAVGEYNPPKEMLTDRGRQYTNWRGKSRFATELAKDRVAHLVSRPQHPMTLGKVERFWATMWQEFLVRAQFDSFESARDRLRLWVKYYNHRRPHQGIGGLCPADRYFEIQGEMKKTIQNGIQENLLEMALRGAPKAPFYLVGRMEGQSVVLKAEKGKLKLSVDDKEMTYELEKGSDGEAQAQIHAREAAQRVGEGPGGAGDLDGAGEDGGGDEDPAGELYYAPAVAGTGNGGDAASLGAEGKPDRRGGAEPEIAGDPGQAPGAAGEGQTERPSGEATRGCSGGETARESLNEREGGGDQPRRDDRAGASGADDGQGRGPGSGGEPQDLLQVGKEGAAGVAYEGGGRAGGSSDHGGSEGGPGPEGRGENTAGEASGGREDRRHPGALAGHGEAGC